MNSELVMAFGKESFCSTGLVSWFRLLTGLGCWAGVELQVTSCNFENRVIVTGEETLDSTPVPACKECEPDLDRRS